MAARYDPKRNVAYSTFARRLLVRRIIRWRKDQHAVRIPHSTQEKVEAQRKNPDTPHKAMPATIAAVDRTIRMSPVPMEDLDDESERPDELASRSEEVELLHAAVLKLPARPRQVLISVLGLFDCEAEPIADVAREMEITVARASELLDQAVAELGDLMLKKEK